MKCCCHQSWVYTYILDIQFYQYLKFSPRQNASGKLTFCCNTMESWEELFRLLLSQHCHLLSEEVCKEKSTCICNFVFHFASKNCVMSVVTMFHFEVYQRSSSGLLPSHLEQVDFLSEQVP